MQPGITIPTNARRSPINAQGQVSATLPGSTTPTVLGQIAADPLRQQGRPAADRRQPLLETPPPARRRTASPNTDGFGDLQQGYLEQANVEAVTEISDLIAAQRAYEMNAKVITAADQMLSSTSNLMR